MELGHLGVELDANLRHAQGTGPFLHWMHAGKGVRMRALCEPLTRTSMGLRLAQEPHVTSPRPAKMVTEPARFGQLSMSSNELVGGAPEVRGVRGQRSEAGGGQRSEVRGQRSEVRGQTSEVCAWLPTSWWAVGRCGVHVFDSP